MKSLRRCRSCAIVAGILVLLMPRLLNYVVALALIVYGLMN